MKEKPKLIEDKELIEASKKWLKLLQERKDEEAVDFYCAEILKNLTPHMRKDFSKNYNREAKYDGLISLLGFTPETVILSYLFAEPDNFVILHTKETKHLLETVVKYTKVPFANFYHEPFTEIPNISIYKALEKAIQRFPKGAKIAIELTGGKKTMGGALAVAAGMLDIDLFYIDYSEYMPEFRKPKPESSYIHLVENPMKLSIDLFGSIEIEKAVEYFNIGKYNVSKELFSQAGSKMANPRIADICLKLSDFYDNWNSFNFVEAVNLSESLFESVLQFHDQISNQFYFDINQLKSHIEVVKELANNNRTYQIWNFYFTAIRNENNNLNDLAVLLFYRTIESTFENALKDIAEKFDRSKPNYKLLNSSMEELRKGYVKHRKDVFTDTPEDEKLPKHVALFDSHCLLSALNNKLAKKIPLGRVASIAKNRNLSVYVHGLNPMEEKSLRDMKNLATDTIEKYSELKGIGTIESQKDKFEFLKLTSKK